MTREALMLRIEQHFGAKVARGTDLAVLMEDICWQVHQWARADALAELHPLWLAEKERADRAEAARQPAPVVAVKTWQERARAYEEKWYRLPPPREVFMQDEIADLRAALAATNRSQP